MKKIYSSVLAMLLCLNINAQTTIDISQINSDYTTTFEGELVIDVATTASTIANPKLSFDNPFKDGTFTEAEISFDVYNYGNLAFFGALIAFNGNQSPDYFERLYFSNNSYLGYNSGGWFDANVGKDANDNLIPGTDFLGQNAWKNVKLQFTANSFAILVDNQVVFDNNATANLYQDIANYGIVVNYLKNTANVFVIGTGSWWSDNVNENGEHRDKQNSYLKNIKFTPDFSTVSAISELEIDPNAKVIGEEYFTVTGSKVSEDYSELPAGLYIKKTNYNNGQFLSSKILKIDKN